MGPARSTRAIVVIVSLWVLACAAALALATTNDEAVAQGCGGGGSPSPSGSGSASPPASSGPIPSLPVTIPPIPDEEAAHPAEDDPTKKTVVGGTAQEAQQTKCNSTVTIAYEAGKNPKFTGKVGSDEPMCKRARNVTVKKLKRGKDATFGKAVTNARGKYTVPSRNDNLRGRFYARVAKATVENDDGQTITCLGARSRAIRP
ncbi:MAG TPA: hypothetical protein VEU29_06615 [Actinomycetota bacterium]|nr:hypothetical protein [Actinomycetota bacterium]